MVDDNTRKEEPLSDPAGPDGKGKGKGKAGGDDVTSSDFGDNGGLEDGFEDLSDPGMSPDTGGEASRTGGKALKKSIGVGLPSDRYRIVLPRGSFPPIVGRQQFIARLRDRDKVSFRIFEGEEDLASQNDLLVEIGMVGIALNNEDKAFLELVFHLNSESILTVRLLDKFGEKESFVALDLLKRPKSGIPIDTSAAIIDRLESLERKIDKIDDRIPTG